MTDFEEKISNSVGGILAPDGTPLPLTFVGESGIYITNGYAYTIGVDESYEDITKINSQQVVGHHMKELEENGVIDRSATLLTLEHRKQMTIEQKILCTGKKVKVCSSPVFNGEGNIVLVVSIVSPWVKRRKSVTYPITVGYDPFSAVEGVVVRSKAMQQIFLYAARAASADSTILISGESGVGKDVIARVIHQLSNRKNKPFVPVNLAAIPDGLFESELFGYREGAFTGALKSGKGGLIQSAAGGTVFLDEISEISLNEQVKLLRVLQDKEVLPVGGVNGKYVNVRFIAATNKNIQQLVHSGHFRQDLFYRLNIIRIHIPPLRERKEDIRALAEYFLVNLCTRHQIKKYFTASALKVLEDYAWPGNVRELQNIVERLVVLSPQLKIDDKQIYEELNLPTLQFNEKTIQTYQHDLKSMVDNYEANLINHVLLDHGNNIEEAAKALKVHRTTLLRKLRRYRSR